MQEPDPLPLRLGTDVDASSQAFDIDDRWETTAGRESRVPLVMQLLQIVGVRYRDGALQTQANHEFAVLQERISEVLKNPKVGFLLEVSIYTNESGNVAIPGGQLLYPIGVGIEPIDAYAEHLRTPQLRPGGGPPHGFNNGTYFVWITRSGEQMRGQTIPSQFRERLTGLASKEARRRHLLGAWERALPGEPYKSIARAQYWTDVARTRAVAITNQARRDEIDRINARMQQLEVRANSLYKEYQFALREIARAQAYSGLLDKVSTVANLLRNGIELGKLISGPSSAPVTGANLSGPTSIPATAEHTNQVIRTYERIRVDTGRSLRYEIERYREAEIGLENIYRSDNIPLPERDEIVIPELP